ncbi:hypothetical protein AKO1_000511, partial [Acrasis kona]
IEHLIRKEESFEDLFGRRRTFAIFIEQIPFVIKELYPNEKLLDNEQKMHVLLTAAAKAYDEMFEDMCEILKGRQQNSEFVRGLMLVAERSLFSIGNRFLISQYDVKFLVPVMEAAVCQLNFEGDVSYLCQVRENFVIDAMFKQFPERISAMVTTKLGNSYLNKERSKGNQYERVLALGYLDSFSSKTIGDLLSAIVHARKESNENEYKKLVEGDEKLLSIPIDGRARKKLKRGSNILTDLKNLAQMVKDKNPLAIGSTLYYDVDEHQHSDLIHVIVTDDFLVYLVCFSCKFYDGYIPSDAYLSTRIELSYMDNYCHENRCATIKWRELMNTLFGFVDNKGEETGECIVRRIIRIHANYSDTAKNPKSEAEFKTIMDKAYLFENHKKSEEKSKTKTAPKALEGLKDSDKPNVPLSYSFTLPGDTSLSVFLSKDQRRQVECVREYLKEAQKK